MNSSNLDHDSIERVMASWRRARPDLDVEPIGVIARLHRLRSLVDRQLEIVFARHGITGPGFAVLATLTRLGEPRVSQRRLMTELDLTSGTVSVRIDRLVDARLVEREPDPDDGRGALVGLTERGRDLFEACAPEHLANERALLAGVSGEDRELLAALLGRLLASLER